MNQREMADALGITQKAYAAWESGLNRPKDIVAVAKQIERLWPGHVMSAWLLGVDGDAPPPPPLPPAANVPRRDRRPVRRLRPVAEPDPDAVSDDALAYLRLVEPAKPDNPTRQPVDEHIDLADAA
jgi:DNA-binding XRE family transcriptional regulator